MTDDKRVNVDRLIGIASLALSVIGLIFSFFSMELNRNARIAIEVVSVFFLLTTLWYCVPMFRKFVKTWISNIAYLSQNSLKERFENVDSKITSTGGDTIQQPEPKPEPKSDIKSFEYKGVKFDFCRCPRGMFTMGSPKEERGRHDDEVQRIVTIDEDFWIGTTQVTQALWVAVGVEKKEKCGLIGTTLPVENVSYYECVAFIDKLNTLGMTPEGWRFDLPTEEQWEYACRAGTEGSDYGVPLDQCAWYEGNSGGRTHEVASKKPNKWGIYDMLGNVWEWTNSKYDDGDSLVYRGGGWYINERNCRPARRFCNDPAICGDDLGFRCVLVRQLSK